MQHKYLLRFIREEMLRQKIAFKNNEAFFRLFVSDEPWEAYRSNMSNWLGSSSKDGVIHKHSFIAAVNDTLGLSPEIWQASKSKQKEAVVLGVKGFKEALEKEELLFPWVEDVGMSEAQKKFIAFAKENSIEEVEKVLESMKESFVKRSDAQSFLVTLLEVMYEKGAYDFAYRHIFPHLLDTYDNGIKAKKAHIYASLSQPMYREAFDILNSIKGDDHSQTVTLQTSAISNIRRERFSSEDLNKVALEGLLQTLIKCYSKIYFPQESQSYYVGINLAYMVSLVKAIFPNCAMLDEVYSVEQIYKEVQDAMAQAKASTMMEEQYYAAMSELEFQLLLGKKGMLQELEYVLESLEPSQHLVDQTKRQMGLFFVDIVEKFADNRVENVDEHKAFLEIFDAYTLSRKKR